MISRVALFVVIAMFAAACSEEQPSQGTGIQAAAPTTSDAPEDTGYPAQYREGDLESRVLAVAADYSEWKSIYLDAQWAPEMCRSPMPAPLMSEAKESSPHGRKLYYLFSNDPFEYEMLTEVSPDLAAELSSFEPGFAMVKEARVPVERDDGSFRPGEKHALFIMLRVEDQIESDDGWVYATTSPDGTRVDAVGHIESCMGCHAKAKFGRLFGPAEGARTTYRLQEEFYGVGAEQ